MYVNPVTGIVEELPTEQEIKDRGLVHIGTGETVEVKGIYCMITYADAPARALTLKIVARPEGEQCSGTPSGVSPA